MCWCCSSAWTVLMPSTLICGAAAVGLARVNPPMLTPEQFEKLNTIWGVCGGGAVEAKGIAGSSGDSFAALARLTGAGEVMQEAEHGRCSTGLEARMLAEVQITLGVADVRVLAPWGEGRYEQFVLLVICGQVHDRISTD